MVAAHMTQMAFTSQSSRSGYFKTRVSTKQQGRLFWLAGADDAYGAYLKLISPWPGQYLDTQAPFKGAFNYFFSGDKRNVIERVLGVMHQQWGILCLASSSFQIAHHTIYYVCNLKTSQFSN